MNNRRPDRRAPLQFCRLTRTGIIGRAAYRLPDAPGSLRGFDSRDGIGYCVFDFHHLVLLEVFMVFSLSKAYFVSVAKLAMECGSLLPPCFGDFPVFLAKH
jgi:hypothetical protein